MINTLINVGRLLFAVAVVSLGLVHLVAGNFPLGLIPVPANFPGRSVLVPVVGLGLVVAGLGIGLRRKADVAAFGLGVLFLLLALALHLPRLLTNLSNGSTWTAFGEVMAFSGGAFYLAGWYWRQSTPDRSNRFRLMTGGKVLFAVSLLIFGILHFVYAPFIATLIPSWIPAPLLWAYFVGVAFVGTAVSLLTNWQRARSSGLLGLMFLLWVVLLHAPRVVASPQIEPEWTSLLVALVMSGIAFMLAGFEGQTTADVRTDALPAPTRMP